MVMSYSRKMSLRTMRTEAAIGTKPGGKRKHHYER